MTGFQPSLSLKEVKDEDFISHHLYAQEVHLLNGGSSAQRVCCWCAEGKPVYAHPCPTHTQCLEA